MISTQATKRPKLADYDFVEEPSEEFYCPVTFELLLEPHQTLCCGNHLSQEAAKRLKGKPCPMCNKRKFGTVPDKFFQRKVNAVKVLCAHKSLGCEWVGELGNLDGHQSQNSVEGECQFVTVACPYSCGDDLQRCQLEGHKANDCPNRPFTCPYCDHKATFIEVTNEHLSLCRNDCPNKSLGCQWAGRRGDLDQHLKGEGGCQYAEVACEFSYLGCKAKVPRLILQAHLTENVKSHLTMLAKHLQQKSDHQQHMIVQLLDTITKQLQTIATQQQAIAKQQQAIAKHQQNFKALTSRMHNITMNEFMKYKQTDGIWISPPFYSSFGGYKMCLMVYGNGDGEYKGTHISVFVALMQGEHDDQLRWPFVGDIMIQLLNQRGDEGHWEKTISFDDRAGDKRGGRVVGKERASGWGYSQFIAHTELNTENKEYLKNDCLKFRISKVAVKSV